MKSFQKQFRSLGLCFFLGIAVAVLCNHSDNEIVSPTPTATCSPSPTLTVSPTPMPTNTPSPTPTPTLSPTPTPSPTPVRMNTLYYAYDEKHDTIYELDVEYQDFLYEMCIKYEIENHYKLLMAQMYHESRFNPNAYSGTNDYGLMQINTCNHEWLSKKFGKTDFFDPYFSIECGVYMMSEYLKKYDDVQKALVCYNSGEGKVKKGTYSTAYSRCVVKDMDKLVEIEQ